MVRPPASDQSDRSFSSSLRGFMPDVIQICNFIGSPFRLENGWLLKASPFLLHAELVKGRRRRGGDRSTASAISSCAGGVIDPLIYIRARVPISMHVYLN